MSRAKPASHQARRAAYFSHRQDGVASEQAAERVGIASTTRRTYERAYQDYLRSISETRLNASKDNVISRLAVAIMDPNTPTQYLANLAARLAAMQGWDLPKRVDVRELNPGRPLSVLLDTWNLEMAAIDTTPAAIDLTPIESVSNAIESDNNAYVNQLARVTDPGAIPPGGGDETVSGSSQRAPCPQNGSAISSVESGVSSDSQSDKEGSGDAKA